MPHNVEIVVTFLTGETRFFQINPNSGWKLTDTHPHRLVIYTGDKTVDGRREIPLENVMFFEVKPWVKVQYTLDNEPKKVHEEYMPRENIIYPGLPKMQNLKWTPTWVDVPGINMDKDD